MLGLDFNHQLTACVRRLPSPPATKCRIEQAGGAAADSRLRQPLPPRQRSGTSAPIVVIQHGPPRGGADQRCQRVASSCGWRGHSRARHRAAMTMRCDQRAASAKASSWLVASYRARFARYNIRDGRSGASPGEDQRHHVSWLRCCTSFQSRESAAQCSAWLPRSSFNGLHVARHRTLASARNLSRIIGSVATIPAGPFGRRLKLRCSVMPSSFQ